MRKSSLVKGLLLGSVIMLLGGNCVAISTKAATLLPVAYEGEVTIEAVEENNRAAQLIWYYKEVDGKKYRRLYDGTNKVWLTDWILCE